MIGITIGIAVAVALIVAELKLTKKQRGEFHAGCVPLYMLIGLLAAFAVDLIAWGIFSGVAIESTKTTEIVASKEIVALQDNSSATGSFFLGSGSVDNKNYYTFYYKSENGYKYMTLDVEDWDNPVYIKYIASDAETPHIDRYAIVERKSLNTDINPVWFSLIAFGKYGKYAAGEVYSERETISALLESTDYYDNFRYEIHIPEGSIQQNYTIDLE